MELVKVSFNYKNSSEILFKELNLQFFPGEVTSFIGPSGCGKSTLLRLMAGLLKPTEGRISFLNSLVSGFVFQDSTLLPWLTVEKNIMLPIKLKNSMNINLKNNEMIQNLGLTDQLEKFPHQLSGGQKMRASIARSLILKPQIVFLDEPFSALDEWTRFKIQDQWLDLKNKFQMTTLLVTHSISEAVYMSDTIHFLSPQKPVEVVKTIKVQKNFSSRYDSQFQTQVKNLSNEFKDLFKEKSV